MSEKVIRDPVHDVITFRTNDPTERLLFNLINAAEFQRLRRIRQLGMAHMAYPGADHSRYAHSLGVMETARRFLDRLEKEGVAISEDERCVCLVASLLHDLGHGPYSHVFERVTGVRHERLTYRVILDAESEIHQLLIRHDKHLPEQVVQLLGGKWPRRFLSEIVSGSLDADRLDYLLRDNLMTGSQYGSFDMNWLLAALAVEPTSQRLVVLPKAVSAVEAYLQARYHMYRNVYFHKVVRSAEGMLKLALRRAKRLAVQDRLGWPTRDGSSGEGGGLARAMLGQRMSMEEFIDLDDVALTQAFKIWARTSDDPALAKLCRGLLFRGLYKSVDLTQYDGDAPQLFVRIAQAVLNAGGDPEYDVFYDDPTDTPYSIANVEKGIKVLQPNGTLKDVSEVSPMTEAMNKQLGFKRVHFAEAYRETVLKVVRSE